MLQTYQAREHSDDTAFGYSLSDYFDILKRRIIFFVASSFAIAVVGVMVVLAQPAIYVSEGRILVESQQIPTELVRPTVTSIAAERIQVIEQRVMTRENLLAIVDKFRLFEDRRNRLSGTEILDLMRSRVEIRPELDPLRRNANAIAFTISFEHERPDLAMRVANEFVTLVLNEDVKGRTSRAVETTKFLEKEVKRLEGELRTIEAQMFEFKRKHSSAVPDSVSLQLITMKADFARKAAVYTDAHPDLKALRRQISTLEQVIAEAKQVEVGIDALGRQHEAAQVNLADASKKLSAARLGESLERDQQSERLDVIEQPSLPQKPIKPNRPKMLALVLAMAGAVGVGAVFAAESLDRTVRNSRDLGRLADRRLIVVLPYIGTAAESRRKRLKWTGIGSLLVVFLIVAIMAFHLFVAPLNVLWMNSLSLLSQS